MNVGETEYVTRTLHGKQCFVPAEDPTNVDLAFFEWVEPESSRVYYVNLISRTRLEQLPDLTTIPKLKPLRDEIRCQTTIYRLTQTANEEFVYVPQGLPIPVEEAHCWIARADRIHQHYFFVNCATSEKVSVLPPLVDLMRQIKKVFVTHVSEDAEALAEALSRHAGREADYLHSLRSQFGGGVIAAESEAREAIEAYYLRYEPEKLKDLYGGGHGYEAEHLIQLRRKLEAQYGPHPPTFRQRVRAIFEVHCSSKLASLQEIMMMYTGQESQYIASLVKQYGPEPNFDPSEYGTAEEIAIRVRSIYLKHCPSKYVSARKSLKVYAGKEYLLLEALIQRYGSEPIGEEKDAIVAQVLESEKQYEGFRSRLVDFYNMYEPDKLDSVDESLLRFRGVEEALFVQLRERYGPEPRDLPESPALRLLERRSASASRKASRLAPSVAPSAVSEGAEEAQGSSVISMMNASTADALMALDRSSMELPDTVPEQARESASKLEMVRSVEGEAEAPMVVAPQATPSSNSPPNRVASREVLEVNGGHDNAPRPVVSNMSASPTEQVGVLEDEAYFYRGEVFRIVMQNDPAMANTLIATLPLLGCSEVAQLYAELLQRYGKNSVRGTAVATSTPSLTRTKTHESVRMTGHLERATSTSRTYEAEFVRALSGEVASYPGMENMQAVQQVLLTESQERLGVIRDEGAARRVLMQDQLFDFQVAREEVLRVAEAERRARQLQRLLQIRKRALCRAQTIFDRQGFSVDATPRHINPSAFVEGAHGTDQEVVDEAQFAYDRLHEVLDRCEELRKDREDLRSTIEDVRDDCQRQVASITRQLEDARTHEVAAEVERQRQRLELEAECERVKLETQVQSSRLREEVQEATIAYLTEKKRLQQDLFESRSRIVDLEDYVSETTRLAADREKFIEELQKRLALLVSVPRPQTTVASTQCDIGTGQVVDASPETENTDYWRSRTRQLQEELRTVSFERESLKEEVGRSRRNVASLRQQNAGLLQHIQELELQLLASSPPLNMSSIRGRFDTSDSSSPRRDFRH